MTTHRELMTAKVADISDPEMQDLARRALEVSLNAYVPASHFQVGCALLTAKGNIVVGCNVENASYGLTICSERNAITTALSVEGPTMKIHKCAVYCSAYIGSPCGACRQYFAEFDADTRIMFVENNEWREHTCSSLLPLAFVFNEGS